jgi:hypothetical protein
MFSTAKPKRVIAYSALILKVTFLLALLTVIAGALLR